MKKIKEDASKHGPSAVPGHASGGINPELLPNLMHNLPGMAYRCKNDSKWSMLFISEGSVELTGYHASELLHNASLSYDEIIVSEDREMVRQVINDAVIKHLQFQMEYRIMHKNGSVRWVWEKGNAVYDKHHNPVFLDGFITDVTARRSAEEELKKLAGDLSELNATKDRFFSLLAHDLQNPVYAIISLSEFIAENFSSFGRKEIEDALLQVHNAARGIYTLLENLLDWARLQTGQISYQKEFVSLKKTIDYAIDHYKKAATQKGIVLEFAYEQDYMAECDLRLLSSILRNLISNAIKYSYPKSKVSIYLRRNGDTLEICVEDKGLGISRRHLQNLFRIDNDLRQYGTANEAGSGLGLILVDNYARLMGAKLHVESKLNHGSKFSLLIPGKI
jgi:PAS domain S-box-containing protein